MITRDKIIENMYELRHSLEEDWTQRLEDLNIYDDVSFIYTAPGIDGDTRMGNIIICYTVLAYDNKSKFLEPHKNRYENKQKILVTLGGLSVMTNETFRLILDNQHEESFKLAEWYVKYQKDWRWDDIISAMEYHSLTIKMSNSGAMDAQEAIHIGKMKEYGRSERISADNMLNDLRTEYLNLDTALEKEYRAKITDIDSINFMSWENHLAARQKELPDSKRQ